MSRRQDLHPPSVLRPALMAAFALAMLAGDSNAEIRLVAERPRVLIRGGDLPLLRERCRGDAHLKPVYEKMRAFAYGSGRSSNLWIAPDELCSIALAYLIEDRDARLLARARGHIGFLREAEGDSWTRPRILKALACAYDWLHADLSEGERRQMAERMTWLAAQMRKQYRHSDYNNHVYLERGPLVYLGLALAGEGLADAEAARALDEAEALLKQHFVPAVNQVGGLGDGGWHESMSYWSFFAYEFAHQLEAWRTATGEDLFAACPALGGAAEWLVYCTRPHDRSMAPVADIESPVRWGDQESAYLPLLAARYRSGLAQSAAQQTPPTHAARCWAYLAWYDPGIAAADRATLPTGRLFQGIGWASMRSGWETDAAWALFVCGDYYAGHQHFDQNSFIIARRGNLAIDAGEYGARQTLFHNTVMIGQGQRAYGNDPRTRFGPTPPGSEFDTGEIVAFEENRLFTYVLGDASNAYGEFRSGRRMKKAPVFLRRFLFLKPATFVVDDTVRVFEPGLDVRWLLHSTGKPEISQAGILIRDQQGELACRTLLPEKVTVSSLEDAGGKSNRQHHRIEIAPAEAGSQTVRFLHVLHARPAGQSDSVHCQMAVTGKEVALELAASGLVYRVWLSEDSPGRIAVATAEGRALAAERPLAAGILPYTADGVKLLERWDSAYRRDGLPGWDTDRTSSNLQEALRRGLVKPCRAAELGCGTGTNAVYLAEQGFDVTGIDIAPSALARAAGRAKAAGAQVQWRLADATNMPDLEPFDFVFDRGCYHGVRQANAAGYVQSLRKLTRQGARVLILAGNANEARASGPPRVKEEQIRADFSADFNLLELRETRFDTRQPGVQGALAWFILLERK